MLTIILNNQIKYEHALQVRVIIYGKMGELGRILIIENKKLLQLTIQKEVVLIAIN